MSKMKPYQPSNRPNQAGQWGYTLIELLLYVAVIGMLLAGITTFFGMSIDARVKNMAISEVDQQGTLIMEHITQTIRNADSITSPAAGASNCSLTLAVPTGSLSPTIFDTSSGCGTVMGYDQIGTTDDSGDSNFMNASKFTAPASGTVTTLFARIGGTVAASPNNQAQMAIYSGTASPSTLLASSSSTTITANSWISFSIPSVSVTSGQTYWLAYNTNGLTAGQNNIRLHTGAANQAMFTSQTYGTWPSSWSGATDSVEFSMYALITAAGSSGTMQIKEGSGAVVALSNSKVQVSNLTFTNLTRSGTPGVVRVSFTVSLVNASGRNEYDYQKTFTATAAIRQ